ncbi:hypothetical protein D4R86_06055, partial [bacterium]
GNVGIGTTNPGNILTIVQSSATDPIADAWTIYSTPESKIVLGTADDQTGVYLEKFKDLSVYKWKRTENEAERLSVLAVTSTPSEILAYDGKGNIQGIDLGGYIGFLHEVMKGQQYKIDELELAINKTGLIKGEDGKNFEFGISDSSAKELHFESNPNDEISNVIKKALAMLTGQVKAAGEWIFDKLTTRHLAIDVSEKEGENPTIGQGKIGEQEQEIKIYNTNIKNSSKIFVSFNSDLGGRSWYISEKHAIPGDDPANNYFIVRLNSSINHDAEFDYWIVQTAVSGQRGDSSPTVQNDNSSHPEGTEGSQAEDTEQGGEGKIPNDNGQITNATTTNATATTTEENGTTTPDVATTSSSTPSVSTASSTPDTEQGTTTPATTTPDLINEAIDVLKEGKKDQEIVDSIKEELGESDEKEIDEEPIKAIETVETLEEIDQIDFENVTTSE